tara:strand:+ start:1944 stop:2381 length:438 start_codon:yes stop_codon:yes gene_type:complete
MKQILDTNYYINKDGQVYNQKTGRFLTEVTKSNGYKRYSLSINGYSKHYYTHRLLGYAYLNLTDDMFMDHINNVRGDNRLSNLQVLTRQEHIRKDNRKYKNLPDFVTYRAPRRGRRERYSYMNEMFSSVDLDKVIAFKKEYENNH